MAKSTGGGGNGGRSGSGGSMSKNGDAGQPGEVFRAAEEAKLQARVDNMNQIVGNLNKEVNTKKQGIANMERELGRFSERDRSTKEIRKSLETNIKKAKREIAIKQTRLVNVYDRMNKIIAENS